MSAQFTYLLSQSWRQKLLVSFLHIIYLNHFLIDEWGRESEVHAHNLWVLYTRNNDEANTYCLKV